LPRPGQRVLKTYGSQCGGHLDRGGEGERGRRGERAVPIGADGGGQRPVPHRSRILMYSAETVLADGIEVAQLRDSSRDMQVSVVPGIGNLAYEFLVRGKNAL